MKKRALTLIFAAFMAMSMTACGGSADSGNTAANEQK